jgi:NACHT domain
MEGKILDAVRRFHNDTQQQVKDLSKDMTKLAKEQSKKVYDDQNKKAEARGLMVDRWRTQNEAKLNQILGRVHQMNSDQKQHMFQRKVLDSLYFEKIDDREHMIEDRYITTLEWVFTPPAENLPKWSEVPAWLRDSGGVYWVSGKAGSGKSTLMKWLFHEDRTRDLLKSWAGDKKLLVTKYFFWSPGTSIQKSLSGLLRSALYDLLQQCPELILQISPARWRSYDLELAHFPAWTDADLLIAIRTFIQATAPSARICLFIDGLDEFDGKDHQRIKVVDFLKELSQLPNIKVCVSSRPWELFKSGFVECPKLRLEDLTRKDIEDYVNASLEANEQFEVLRRTNSTLCSQLVSEIVGKAQGVWLWVILVVRSLLQGLRNDDSVSDLLNRLRSIPEDLEKFFLQMFYNIDEFYRPKALKTFKMALQSRATVSLMTLSFLDDESAAIVSEMPTKAYNEDEVRHRLDLTESRLNIRCLGLLESIIHSDERPLFLLKNISFLHRTAQDFLLDYNTQKLIGMESVASFDVAHFICIALLAQMQILRQPLKYLLHRFIIHAEVLEKASSESLMSLLVQLNDVLDSLRYRSWSTNLANVGLRPRSIEGTWNCTDQGPVPLLSLGIQFGLGRYAKQVLDSDPSLVAKQPGRPLLDYALRRKIYSTDAGQAEQMQYSIAVDDQPDVELVRMILAYGGDPNEEFAGSTVWKFFLGFFDAFGNDFASNIGRPGSPVLQPWMEVTELLIRYGAVRVLESERIVPNQSAGKTRIKLGLRQKLARDSLKIVFGEAEAARLDSLSWWLSATGQNLSTRITRSIRSLLGRSVFG